MASASDDTREQLEQIKRLARRMNTLILGSPRPGVKRVSISSAPPRESTRGSANRAKADSAFNLTEEAKKGSPENRARKSRARVAKVRGGGARPAR